MFSLYLSIHGEEGTPVRTRKGYPYPRQDEDSVPPHPRLVPTKARTRPGQGTPLPPIAGNATDRIRRGRYASCIFTQGDFVIQNAIFIMFLYLIIRRINIVEPRKGFTNKKSCAALVLFSQTCVDFITAV